MSVFYAFSGIFPFGEKTAAWCDLDQQTIPLLMNFKDILSGESSIFYTVNSGGGINFWGVFFFFLASPFYLAVKFIAKQDMSYFVTVLIVLKLSVCAFTASLYFSSAHKKLDGKYIVLLSLIYSFCGYGLMYYQTLVWLDIMYLFPVLVMSVDRMFKKNNCIFYIITLSAVVTVNYYLSYMIVIFLLISSALYIHIRCPENQRKAASCRFILSSFAAALITAPVWLCSAIQVKKSARSSGNLEEFICSPVFESFKDKLCIIITSAFTVSAVIFIIKSPLLKKKRVKYNLTVLLFLAIPLLLDSVNKVWHGGGYQSFPFRYGYMLIFTLLDLTADILVSKKKYGKTSPLYGVVSFIILALFSFTAFYVVSAKKDILSQYADQLAVPSEFFNTLFGLFLFAFAAYVLFFYLHEKKLIGSRIFFLLISGVFITETFINMSVYIGNSSKKDELFDNTAELEYCVDEDGLYRTKTEKKYIHANMPGGLGMRSYAHYTSLNPESYLFAMKKLGYSSYWMETGSNGGTVMTDALLGIKYSIGGSFDFASYQKELDTNTYFRIAENLICAPAGIILNKSPQSNEELKLDDRYNVQKQLAQCYFDDDSLLEKYVFTKITGGEYKYSDEKYNITASDPEQVQCQMIYDLKISGHQTLYFDLFDELDNNVFEPIYNSVSISVNERAVNKSFPNKNSNGLLKLGEFDNENVKIVITFLKDVSVNSFGVFGIDIDKLEDNISKLEKVEPKINKNKIYAEFNAEKDSYLYLAVPYDSGFNTYVNGKKAEIIRVNDCFCAVKINEGKNNLKMTFYPNGFKISLILMILGLILTIFINFSGKFIFEAEKYGIISIVLCRSAFFAVIVLVYIIPVIVHTAGIIIRLTI
ncbi:MAG: YfhO family protein [Clostridium sp.]|nr:YfhO family protein [Clostridium sp.]MCM1548010.1 YfhO family protein [Ruminococcus sp.]